MSEQRRSSYSHQKAKSAVNNEDSSSYDNVASMINVNQLSSSGWCIDSGETSHINNDRSFFTKFSDTKPQRVMVANGQYMMSAGVGNGYINCQVSDNVYTIPVSDVLYVPTLETNLLSVKKLTKQGHTVQFKGDIC